MYFIFIKNGNYWTILGDYVSTALYFSNIEGQRDKTHKRTFVIQ